jgi:hypothetical protein
MAALSIRVPGRVNENRKGENGDERYGGRIICYCEELSFHGKI